MMSRIRSFKFAINGLFSMLRTEHNARVQALALTVVVTLGFVYEISPTEWIAVVVVSGAVMAAEAFNTAIERLADFVEPQWNEKIGVIKDLCAAAVLLTAVSAAVVGGIVFIPKILG